MDSDPEYGFHILSSAATGPFIEALGIMTGILGVESNNYYMIGMGIAGYTAGRFISKTGDIDADTRAEQRLMIRLGELEKRTQAVAEPEEG